MAWLQVNFFSNLLMRSVPLNIMIPADVMGPPEMQKAPVKPFKTLYLLHGYMGNCNDWILGADIQAMSQEFNIAIVMPSGNNDFYVDAPNGAKSMSKFISEELVDFTRRLLPLSHEREDTIIGGLSMGGFGTLYNCFTHNDVFGHGIALSAPMILEAENLATVTDEPNFMGITKGYYHEVFSEDFDSLPTSAFNPKVAAKLMMERGGPIPDMYIACGYNDMLREDNRSLCDYLDSIGMPYFYEEGPGTHEWAFWNPYLRRGLAHVIKDAPPAFPNPFWVEKDNYERSNG